jgi:hypothetical protein
MDQGHLRECTCASHTDETKLRLGFQTHLSANIAQLAGAVLPPIFEMWEEEEERDVVNELCNSFSAALMVVGPALIVPQCEFLLWGKSCTTSADECTISYRC